MIKEIYVNNFKSLHELKMCIKSGLNVMVGPNGSGKTNIINFFEFMKALTSNDLVNAVSSMGGVGSIFRKTGENQFCKSLDFTVFGSSRINSRKFIVYKYIAKISIVEDGQTIVYESQRIQIKFRTVDTQKEEEIKDAWDIDIEANTDNEISIHKANKGKISFRFMGDIKSSKSLEIRLKEVLGVSSFADESLLSAVRILGEDFWPIRWDLLSIDYYNIIPSRVKLPEDGASEPFIRKDGSGLSATLFAIKKHEINKPRINRYYDYPRRYYNIPKGLTLKKITEYIKLANSSIVKIDVENSAFDNQLQVKVTIGNEADKCTLPFSALSDGTIKWIVFVTLLFSKKSIFSIEEPENYLHPAMQSELINLIRNIGDKSGQILMTTHSETILNSLKPEEIQIVSFEEGGTKVKWLENPQEISDEIARTGFGLGYFYISGGVL